MGWALSDASYRALAVFAAACYAAFLGPWLMGVFIVVTSWLSLWLFKRGTLAWTMTRVSVLVQVALVAAFFCMRMTM